MRTTIARLNSSGDSEPMIASDLAGKQQDLLRWLFADLKSNDVKTPGQTMEIGSWIRIDATCT